MRAPRTIVVGDNARQQMKAGVDLVADVVKLTLGPKGRNVTLDVDPYGPPLTTNDGVSIAREINSKDDVEQVGVKRVKAVAAKTDDVAGDGTTTATLLTQSIINAGMKFLDHKVNAISLRRGIEAVAAQVAAELRDMAKDVSDVKDLTNVATISAGGDEELGKLIAELVEQVGADGVITIEDNNSYETESKVVEGVELRGGYMTPFFITNKASQTVELKDVPIFVTDLDVTNGLEVIRIMEACDKNGHKQAAIIANSISGEALMTIINNWQLGKFNLLPVRVNAFGEQGEGVLRDAAAAADAKFYSKQAGDVLGESLEFDDLGFVEKLVVTKDRTTLIGFAGEVDERITELEAVIPTLKKSFEIDQIKQRIARLKAAVGTISVGSHVDSEGEERKKRVEDAVKATKAALEKGIVLGGGVALHTAAASVVAKGFSVDDADEVLGARAVIEACSEPIKQMAKNASIELGSSLQNLKDNEVLDFDTGKIIDGAKAGIFDPLKVVESALINASHEAALFLTTEAVVVATTDDSEKL